MKIIYKILVLFFFILSLFLFAANTYAIVDPLLVPNNKFGVHILFPSELDEARRLVNSSGGDWGYATIPIQAADKNLVKWQKFMDSARILHLIPIIRLATENYYFNTTIWRKPNETDVLDFANFLDSLDWPTKNRYIIIFNEVNRADEWGGDVNPREYAEILQYAVMVFKSKNQDFFIISAGLDNGASSVAKQSMDEYKFMKDMNDAIPGIFSQIDAIGSHSYPNPGFSQPPWVLTPKSINSFKYEKDLAEELSGKNLPIFITETGWSLNMVSESKIASYYEEAFQSAWTDKSIIAVTPFLLRAGSSPFDQFSLINNLGNPSISHKVLENIQKIKGNPVLNNTDVKIDIDSPQKNLIPRKTFLEDHSNKNGNLMRLETVKTLLKWFVKP